MTPEHPNTRGARRWLKPAQYASAIAGSLLVGAWMVAWIHGTVLSRKDLARFESARSQPLTVRPIQPVDEAVVRPVDTTLWSEQRIAGFQESLVHDFDLPMAVMRIPSVDIEVPVLPGTDDVTLNRGVGWIEGTALPGTQGNFAVAGHRDGFFRGLKDIELGDPIEVETLQGSSTYIVDELTVVDPSDVSVLEPRETASLTLVTCYPFYFVGSAPRRFIVHASVHGEDAHPEGTGGVELDSGQVLTGPGY